jgi:gliding motility-associated-like protein
MLLEEDVTQLSIGDPGIYFLEIRNTANGCTNREQFVVEENTTPPNFSLVMGDPFTCERQSAIWEYLGTDSVPVEVGWFEGSNLVGNMESFVLNADDAASSYLLHVQRLDNGCADSLSFSPQWDTMPPMAQVDSVPVLPCDGSSVFLSGNSSQPIGELTFRWEQNGSVLSQQAQLEATESGRYELWVTWNQNGCTDSTGVRVTSHPILDFELTVDPLLCTRPYGEIEVNQILGGTPPFEYSLNGIETNNEGFFSNLEAGQYTVSVLDALGCQAAQTISLDSLSDMTLDLQAEVILNYNDQHQIFLESNRLEEEIAWVQWSPENQLSCTQCLHPWITAHESEELQVQIEDMYGCQAEAVLRLIVELNPQIFIPNIFSPNGDGINDRFFPNAGPTVVNIPRMMLFDRWGNLLFEQRNFPPNAPQMGWNGRYKGELLDPAVFAYLIEVELVTGEILTFSGDVTLVK